MKKIIVLVLSLFYFLSPMIADDLGMVKVEKYGSNISFKLPYRKAKGRNKYFNEEVGSALIVDKIIVNGNPIIPEPDYTLYLCLTDEYKMERFPSSEEFAYIRMSWQKEQNKKWIFPYRGNLFVVEPGTKATVFYRIIYPFPFGNSEKLLQRRFNKKYISPVYSATIFLPGWD